MVDDSCSNGITQNVERSQEGIQEPVHTKENANLKDSTSIIHKFVKRTTYYWKASWREENDHGQN